jgi:hypothetical protein
VTEIQEKVDVSADTMKQVFTTNSDADRTFTVSTEQVVSGSLEQPMTDRMRAISPSEIAWMVRHPKPREAAGPDWIYLLRVVLKFIAKLFTRSLALNYFPT